jgi:probable HAF family extracellular repeat protein
MPPLSLQAQATRCAPATPSHAQRTSQLESIPERKAIMRRVLWRSVLLATGVASVIAASSPSTQLSIRDLGTLPGGDFSTANGINDRGQIVGQASTATRALHVFLWTRGTMVDLVLN